MWRLLSAGQKFRFTKYSLLEDDGKLILDRYNRYREFGRVRQEYKSMTEKHERKLLTNP